MGKRGAALFKKKRQFEVEHKDFIKKMGLVLNLMNGKIFPNKVSNNILVL